MRGELHSWTDGTDGGTDGTDGDGSQFLTFSAIPDGKTEQLRTVPSPVPVPLDFLASASASVSGLLAKDVDRDLECLVLPAGGAVPGAPGPA